MLEMSKLNREQRAAAEHRDGHLLILAGAGTGKTRTLVHRLASLLEEGVSANKLLAITFTNKAASELKERLEALVGSRADAVVCGTFHGTAARFLRQRASAIGWPNDFVIYDERDQRALVSGLLNPGDDVTPGALLKAMEKHRLNPEVALPSWDRSGLLAKDNLPMYRSLLKAAGAVDFLGLIEGGAALAEGGFLPRFSEVLVDEFQDTDRLQHRWLEALAGFGARIVAVGDDDQSIYGWRGADVSGMLLFEKNYSGAKRVTLSKNYRSKQNILDAANRLIGKNKHRLGKELLGVKGAGDPLEVLAVADERAEGHALAQQFQQWLDKGVEASELAVLARLNSQLRGLEVSLAAAGIPYSLVGGRALFETRESRDVCAFLRLWLKPQSDLDLLRIINRPTRGLGRGALEKIQKAAGSRPLLPFLIAEGDNFSTRIRKGIASFVAVMEPPPANVREGIERVLYDAGYLEWVCNREPERADEREANLLSLLGSADQMAGPDGDLATFLERWSLAGGGDLERGAGLRLMTIHASKGLEFDAVFLPGWDEGLFPMPDSEGERFDQIEEERRLAYVALTRARNHCVISWARARMHHGRTLAGRASRFIGELAGDGVHGYAQHPFAGRQPADLPKPRLKAAQVPAFDELAQVDYGDQQGGAFKPGDLVLHERFGRGVIQTLRGSGSSAKVEIRFGDGSSRTIIASYLQPCDNEWDIA
jgi:DNA helicase-2/ATP-dependent DNA helicase PcrA